MSVCDEPLLTTGRTTVMLRGEVGVFDIDNLLGSIFRPIARVVRGVRGEGVTRLSLACPVVCIVLFDDCGSNAPRRS